MAAQVPHRLRFFSLIGPCRPHWEQVPGAAAWWKHRCIPNRPGAGTDGTGSAAHGAGAALRRRQQAMQIGWPLGRAATGRGLPQSVQVSAGRVAPWQRMHIGPASVRL